MPADSQPAHPHLGDCCGEPTSPRRANPWIIPVKLGRFERIIQIGRTLLGIATLAVLIVIVVLFLFSSATGIHAAEIVYPVAIPSECVDLAERKGEPIVMENKRQALKTKARLWTLSNRERGVADCRAAVKRLERAMKQ